MTQEEIYKQHGYLILKKFFSSEQCDQMSEKMKLCADKQYSSFLNPDRIEYLIPQSFKNSKKKLTDNVDEVERIVETSKYMRSIMLNTVFLEKINKITGKKNVPICSHYFFKQPNTIYAKQSWVPHQDNHWTKNTNNQLHLAHIALERATVENGCLYLYDESHKNDLLPVVDKIDLLTNSLSPGRLIDMPESLFGKKVNCLVDKGDVVICHGNTIHGSYPNKTNHSRQTFAIHYIPKGEKFLAGERARRKVIED